jgi:peptidoglycan-associated lipoprotein
MSNLRFASRRPAIASAALLSLVLLAACESTNSTNDPAKNNPSSPGTDTASTNNGSGPIGQNSMQTLTEQLTSVGDRVRFPLDRYDLTPEAQATLQKQAALLQSYPRSAVTIEGHADERGTREYNLALGERRADTVRNYLIALGIPPQRIATVSYGKERPECPEAAESCWAQNRRGVTLIDQ